MKQFLLSKAIKLNKERKQRKAWQKIVRGMASVVVFCTTYALILPAITMEQTYTCGLEDHTHEEACYETVHTYDWQCTYQAEDGVVVAHAHDAMCYDADGVLWCALEERPVHTHEAECYEEAELVCELDAVEAHIHGEDCSREKVLTCGLEEETEHVHDDTCSIKEKKQVCDLEEAEGHAHSEDCGTVERTLKCKLDETEGHRHDETCTGTVTVQVCKVEESEGHQHDDDCYTTQALTCELKETEGHTHSAACAVSETVQICELEASEEHEHTDACYEVRTKYCDLEEVPAHKHSDECSGSVTVLECQKEEAEGHRHGEECFVTQDVTCELPEAEPHAHDDTCYEQVEKECDQEESEGHRHNENCYEEKIVECELEENVPHVHDETCYAEQTETCDLEETEGHSHEDDCYAEPALKCELEEIELHQHEQACYDEEQKLICTLQVVVEHQHTESCMQDNGETIRELICEVEEHTHEDACIAEEAEPEGLDYLCGFGIHEHNEACLDEAGELTCSIPVHSHSAACVVENWDDTQDVEAREMWDSMFADMERTDNWRTDLVAVAESQLEYRESVQNCILDGQTLKGYTRYGAWHGAPYADWSSQFVHFCMEYSGIRYYPVWDGTAAWDNPNSWMLQLQKDGYFRDAAEYTPIAGDLVFVYLPIDAESNPMANYMGIVTEVLPATEESPAKIRMIAGDVADAVGYVTYEIDDPSILGYGEMLSGFATEKGYTGEDFVIHAEFTADAKIPMNAVMVVREILPDTEEYELYYSQSVASLLEQIGGEMEEDLGVTFARFFDISFMLKDQKLEPETPVAVQIQYAQPIELTEEQHGQAVHFAEEGVEILEADLSGVTTVPEEAEAPQQVDTFSFTQDSFSVTGIMLTNARIANPYVYLDGTCGGLMAYTGSTSERRQLINNQLPTEWQVPTRYGYKLNGWYDVTNGQYYDLGATVNVDNNTVFYADWVAANYSVAQPNSHTVTSMDTSDFVTTYVFDYNELFNMYSTKASIQVDNNRHSETWTLIEQANGTVQHQNAKTLGFIFRSHDERNKLPHPILPNNGSIVNEPEVYQQITPGIYSANLAGILFSPSNSDGVLGKHYLGTGNYLYQYMDDPNDEHYGYYFYDSSKNAASYNQAAGRFYIYDYKEYTQDTIDNGYDDTNADFLPFNHPAANANLNNRVVYASTDSQSGTLANFFYGIRSDIHFYLPGNAGERDDNHNFLNKSPTGDDMVFEFYGDDDVWVLLDGELILDVGGIHLARGGKIDFAEGYVYTSDGDKSTYVRKSFQEVLGHNVTEGPHNLTIYYLERGSSMSNCAIYFNLAPRYGLTLEKEDYVTGEKLEGVSFSVYTDESCTPGTEVKLWLSHEAAKADQNAVFATFETNSEGVTQIWGLVAGRTYYIKETGVPPGYRASNDVIRVTLNNHGTEISEVTVLRKEENPQDSEGFEVIFNTLDKENHQITIRVTNKKPGDQLTSLRAEKQWSEDTSRQIPVQMQLKANGQNYGAPVTLSVDNAWGHTWLNLPMFDASGDLIHYTVEEIHLPGYQQMGVTQNTLTGDKVNWVKVAVMEDKSTFILAWNQNTVLMANGSSLGSTNMEAAQSNTAAQWTASAYKDGFRLKSGNYYLAFDNDQKNFYLTSNSGDGNQTFYFDGTQLFVNYGNSQYYPDSLSNGKLSANTSGKAMLVYKKLVTTDGTVVYSFTNAEIPEEQQTNLRIEKIWDCSDNVIPDELVVYLKQGGQTVATVTLTAENNWSAVVEGIDRTVLEANGYSLEEEVPFGFTPTFGEMQDVSIDRWNQVSGYEPLQTGKVYTFVSGGRALTDRNGTVTMTDFHGTPAENQQWRVVEAYLEGGTTIQALKNVATGKYLKEDHSNLKMVDNTDNQCKVVAHNGRLQYYAQSDGNGWNLNIDRNGSLGVLWETNNATTFTFYQHEVQNEFLLTVTNTYAVYVMPETGGMGTAHYYTFGGLLVLAAALMYLLDAVCRRRKGGR